MVDHKGDFPHPLYSKYVLEPTFHEAQLFLFEHMLRANRAHAVMLQECDVIKTKQAAALLSGLKKIEKEGSGSFAYQAGVEDLFFAVEKRLIELTGSDAGGNLQLARSRNDLGYALTRLVLRKEYLKTASYLLSFYKAIMEKAEEHLYTIMPGYTHTQPAQPTTFAHYLCGMLESSLRFFERLKLAYQLNNLSPLGAAALTGTGFSIDRQRVADLLGFEGLILSTQDSIGAGDNLSDAAALISSFAVFLSRVSKDFIFWCTQESGAIQVDDSFIQISSIMPQKRNPVVIEHLRARISRMLGLSQGILIQCHNIPYGDTQDVEDEIDFFVHNAFQTTMDVLDLYTAVFNKLKVNKERLEKQAGASFITVTELADTLVREAGLPFRQAHGAVSRLVQYGLDEKLSLDSIPVEKLNELIEQISGKPIGISADIYRDALDPKKFIEKRNLPGGSAPQASQKALEVYAQKISEYENWLENCEKQLAEADRKLTGGEDRILQSV